VKRGLSVAFACALVAGAAWAGAAGARPTQCATVSNAIVEAQFHRFNDSWATGDPGKVTALFAPDAVLLATVSNTPRTTPAAIRDYFVHFLEGKPVAHIDSSAIRLGCNMAARFGTWSIDLNDAAGKRTTVHARYTFIYTYAGGHWWIEHLHSSKMPETKPSH
jgi:uncharacterized protein (TIGR02246 family)